MPILYEVLKVVFFIFSVAMGLFYVRGYYFMQNSSFVAAGNILLPAYLILTGIMVGYLWILYNKTKLGDALPTKYRVKGFMIGLIAGLVFAGIYIFL